MTELLKTPARPCAGLLAGGLALLLLAPWPAFVGFLQRTASSGYYSGQGGTGLMWLGAALSVTGIALLALGTYRLGQHLDRLGGVRYRENGQVAAPPL